MCDLLGQTTYLQFDNVFTYFTHAQIPHNHWIAIVSTDSIASNRSVIVFTHNRKHYIIMQSSQDQWPDGDNQYIIYLLLCFVNYYWNVWSPIAKWMEVFLFSLLYLIQSTAQTVICTTWEITVLTLAK